MSLRYMLSGDTGSVMNNTEKIKLSLEKRYLKEYRFRWYGRLSIIMSSLFLVILLSDIIIKSLPAFFEYQLLLEVDFKDDSSLQNVDVRRILKESMLKSFPDVTGRQTKRKLMALLSIDAEYTLAKALKNNPQLLGTTQKYWLKVDDDVAIFLANPEHKGRLSDQQISWISELQQQNHIRRVFNYTFFTHSDSREPELAGILGALKGSLLTGLVTLSLSFPLGVLTALYLEEFAPRNRWIDIIEININNLAAVPSIIFGLLGLAVFINVFHMPRSASVVGGCVLALMTLPTIIIASRAAIKAVPDSIRQAAIAIGASKMQTVFQHVVPYAMPGILTGSIIGMAQALGETAPLLMIGMVAFIVDVPQSILDPATVLPVQIYLWADSPEKAFMAKTSAAILVLLIFLILMNALSIFLRNKFEQKGN